MNDHLTSDHLIDYAHGELRADDDAFVHAHLATCHLCREELAAEVALTEVLRAEPAFAERELPGAVRAAIWSAVDAERPPLASRLAALFRPIVAVPLVGFAAVMALFIGLGHEAPAGPSVDVAYYLEAHAAQQAENPFGDRSSPAVIETSMLGSDASAGTADAPVDAASGTTMADAGYPETLAVAAASTLDLVR